MPTLTVQYLQACLIFPHTGTYPSSKGSISCGRMVWLKQAALCIYIRKANAFKCTNSTFKDAQRSSGCGAGQLLLGDPA